MFSVLLYVGAAVAANLSVAAFGPAVTPINAFFLIGLDLALRDSLHAKWQHSHLGLRMGLLIGGAGVLSYLLNPTSGKIAVASLIAFVVANVVDTLVFQRLRAAGYLTRANASNTAAAAVDSVLFPTLAFGELLPVVVLLQFLAKTSGGFVWSLVIRARLAK